MKATPGSSTRPWTIMTIGAAIFAAAFTVSAQTPAPPAAPQQPQAQAGGAPPPEPGAQPPARGRGRGNPQEVLAGGPQATDAAYAELRVREARARRAAAARGRIEESSSRSRAIVLELVLSDPDIQEPPRLRSTATAACSSSRSRLHAGRRCHGQLDPIGRISLHTDTNNDGVYDKHSVFVDKLVFPRFMTPFGPNTILAKESNAQEVWKYTDTNNDGVADKKELFDTATAVSATSSTRKAT
jgi:hypothetical protein